MPIEHDHLTNSSYVMSKERNMDAKEIKTALKNAREAIRIKDYKEALKHCKGILKYDKNNYNALVFVGVAAVGMEQTEQAIMAYKRAIETSPDQVLAWQGICGLYEKQNTADYQADLAKTYEKLLDFYESDSVKKCETSMKLADLYCIMNQEDKAIDLYNMLSVKQTGSAIQAYRRLIEVLSQTKPFTDSRKTQLEEAYSGLLKIWTDGGDELNEKWKTYIHLLRQKCTDQQTLVSACGSMMERCSDQTFPVEVLCLLHSDSIIKGDHGAVEEMKKYSAKLSEMDDTSPVLCLSNGHLKVIQKDYLAASKLLTQGLLVLSGVVSGWILLARAQCALHDRESAAQSIKQGIQALQRKDRILTVEGSILLHELQLIEVHVLSESQGQHELLQAVELCKSMLKADGTDRNVQLILAETQLNQAELNVQDKASSCLNDALQIITSVSITLGEDPGHVIALTGWHHCLNGDYEQAEKSLQQAVKVSPHVGKYHYWLARVYWSGIPKNDSLKTKFFSTMLQAGKLDPYHSNTFVYLGHYYCKVRGDNEKASRCYQKAYDLDNDSEVAGIALVDSLATTGNVEKMHQILTRVTSQASAGSVKWAWLRLGLHELHHGNTTQAITSLQCALRADPMDTNCWECLGEGYMSRGSYTAALKAFTRASQLSQQNVYSLYQIAKIKHILGQYTEAVEDYKIILEKTPDYVPALTGIGDTYLNLAKSSLGQFFHGRAVDQCQTALAYLTRAASQRADLSCVWKLMGDACTILHCLDSSLVKMTVSAKLLTQDQKAAEKCILGKSDILALGTRCYGRCVKLAPGRANIWHDLGLSYYHQAQTSADTTASQRLASSALQALKQAIRFEPSSYVYWSTLGTVSASAECDNPDMAQHCFIKSTQLEPNNVKAWTNLGALYLKHDNIKLAHEAFKTAQSLEPSHVTSWIGQALIAETVGHEEAMDLFRHATELAHHTESCLGYSHWVCSTVRNTANRDTSYYSYAIQQMSAVPMACDALARYTDRVQSDYTAWNLYGLMLERQRLYTHAAKAFARATELLYQTNNRELVNKAQANLARTLCASGQFEESVKQYLAISPLTEFEDICGLGMAQYKFGNLKESFQAYEQSLELAPSEHDKSQVYTALAMVAYKFRDNQGAKSSLFKASQMSPPSTEGLLALCSLGLMQRDMTLAGAVMSELHKSEVTADHRKDVTLLSSLLHQLQGNHRASRNHICKAIYHHPDSASLWSLLAKNLHVISPDGASVAAVCAKIAGKGKPKNEELSRLEVASLVGVGLDQHTHTSVLNKAKKCVHLYPDNVQNWSLLLAAGQAEHIISTMTCGRSSLRVVSISSRILARVEEALAKEQSGCIQTLHMWCAKQYAASLLSTGRHREALQFLTMVGKLFTSSSTVEPSSPSLAELLAFLNTDTELLRSMLKPGDTVSTQLLAELLVKRGSVAEAVALLQEQLHQAVPHRIQLLTQIAHLSLIQLKTESASGWEQLCAESLKAALDADPICSTALFLQVSLAVHQNNSRVLRRSLEKLLSCAPLADGVSNMQRKLARRLLLPIYQDKGDVTAVQSLVETALEEEDTDFVQNAVE